MKTETEYKNPWYNPHLNHYGPEFYVSPSNPKRIREYRGFSVCCVWPKEGKHSGHYDIVRDGVCVSQRAGDTNHGLNKVIDGIFDGTEERIVETMARMGVSTN